jgi:hypothetical protein
LSERLYHHTFRPWVADGDRRVVASEREWRKPLEWSSGRVLVDCEFFEEWSGPMGTRRSVQVSMPDARMRLFQLAACTNLDWMFLTERLQTAVENWPLYAGYHVGERIKRGLPVDAAGISRTLGIPRIWCGTPIRTQSDAESRVPALLHVPAAVRWLWVEPREGIHLTHTQFRLPIPCPDGIPGCEVLHCGEQLLHLVVIVGSVGPDAPPTDLAHVRDLIRQCREAGVPCWVERLGSRWKTPLYDSNNPNYRGWMEGKFRDPDGADPSAWAEDLQVRQLPEGREL